MHRFILKNINSVCVCVFPEVKMTCLIQNIGKLIIFNKKYSCFNTAVMYCTDVHITDMCDKKLLYVNNITIS